MPRVNRLCPIGASNQIEDESHFLIYCNKYSILRNKFYEKEDDCLKVGMIYSSRTYHSDF